MIKTSNRSEWLITLIVIVCSAILLTALAFAIGGNPFRPNTRLVRAVFPDITGIRVNSPVKYAGSHAGTVTAIRMLPPDERAKAPNPSNNIEVTLALNARVPEFTAGTYVSLSADTILADKFVLIHPGAAVAEPLAADTVLSGIAPTTFDALSAEVVGSLQSLRSTITALRSDTAGNFFEELPKLLDQVSKTLADTQALVGKAGTLVDDGTRVIGRGDTLISETSGVVGRLGGLVDDSKPEFAKLLTELQSVATQLDTFAARAEKLIRENEKPITRTTTQLERAVLDLRITSAHAKTLAESLARRPQQLIWGPRRAPNTIRSDEEILAE
ncbi:MAG: MlaD family protein [Chthoniobacterales bacterium]